MITTPEQAVAAATCALARISTFKSQGLHNEGCSFCKIDPRDLCRMVAEFMDDSANEAAIRLFEHQSAQTIMTEMWV